MTDRTPAAQTSEPRTDMTPEDFWRSVGEWAVEQGIWKPEAEAAASAEPQGSATAQPATLRVEYNTGRTHGYEEGYRAAAPAGLDVERLARAMYAQMRASYRDPRRAPPPWDLLFGSGTWTPRGGTRYESLIGIREDWLDRARVLAAAYAEGEPHG